MSPPYDAIDIARFIVQSSREVGNPVTNAKLQKLLYYAWVGYYGRTHTYLFSDAICAWRFGPIIPSVHREYRIWAGVPILRTEPPSEIDGDTKRFLLDFIRDNSDFTASRLVNLPNREGYPWDGVYDKGRKFTPIPFERIVAIERLGDSARFINASRPIRPSASRHALSWNRTRFRVQRPPVHHQICHRPTGPQRFRDRVRDPLRRRVR